MKYVKGLEYVLQNAPVRSKDPEKKVCRSVERELKTTMML